jgi:hypothetical protein
MVVPDGVHRRGAEELLHHAVGAIVAMLAVKLLERGRHVIRAADVRAHAARLIGVHGVTDEEEEIGATAAHGPEDAIAVLDIAAVPVAAEIAAPHEPHRRVRVRGRGRRERAVHGSVHALHLVDVTG